jgi:hypothetical protein
MFPYEPIGEQNNCDMTHSDLSLSSYLILAAVYTTSRTLPGLAGKHFLDDKRPSASVGGASLSMKKLSGAFIKRLSAAIPLYFR